MIKLTFLFDREPFNFVVKQKEIFYTQRKFAAGTWVRCMPPPENFTKIVAMSRNKIPPLLINMFKFTEEEMKEYETANTEEELANIIIRDAKSKGCIFVNKINEPISEPEVKNTNAS